MKITLIKSHSSAPCLHTRTLKDKWPKGANVAFRFDMEWAVLFIQGIPSIRDGWPTNDIHGKVRKGWYFRETLMDNPPEQMSYQHLLKGESEMTVYFFFVEDCQAKQMHELATAIRDYIELVL